MAPNSSDDPNNNDDESSVDDDADIAFSAVDFSGVDFDDGAAAGDANAIPTTTAVEELVLALEREIAFGDFSRLMSSSEKSGTSASSSSSEKPPLPPKLKSIGECLASGRYADALRSSDVARDFFFARSDDGAADNTDSALAPAERGGKVASSWIRQRMFAECRDSVTSCVELELIGVAAFNLFLQANYTGPAVEVLSSSSDSDDKGGTLAGINPHPCFAKILCSGSPDEGEGKDDDNTNELLTTKPRRDVEYQNAVLSELAVDGEWPCQVCTAPYFLLLARSIFTALADPCRSDDDSTPPAAYVRCTSHLPGARLWCARSAVAHERLLQARQPTVTLWKEVEEMYQKSIQSFCPKKASDDDGVGEMSPDKSAAAVMLEWGLAQHHFDRPEQGKEAFVRAQNYSGLLVEVTGAEGKRTKFQQKATAQMLVKATSSSAPSKPAPIDDADRDPQNEKGFVRGQMVEHGEDGILLERIKFEDDKENEVTELDVLDQAILLSLCLDVKNSNPADGLTAEEMGAYLARVLEQQDDWMVYSTALLERAWLEFERSHGRERAILQMQALADQHTERLTITQSTRESIEESAPVQERLKMLQCIVYPPRWAMIQDLADRYASLGVVTSAAELYTEVELWDDVVECYRRAEKLPLAEKIVRERLAVQETPRMWSALGDLTNDPEHYKRAIELSNGRYSDAYVALGAYYFQKGDLPAATENYECALKVRPLAPRVWFRLGTICMQLGRWEKALRAFSEVVQQEPEEAEAWANVAAIHIRNKQPAQAYPALVESLRRNRNNWRIWISKLYACLDLQKYDEAIQACNTLLDLKDQRQAAEGVPPLEEKCVRAIVGGTVKAFADNQGDATALESSRRTLTRVSMLLHRICSSSDAEPWVYESRAFFHEQVGQDDKVLEDLNQQYRSLIQIQGWEKDDNLVRKVCGVTSHIVALHAGDEGGSSRESLTKAKFLARGVAKRVRTARPDDAGVPAEVALLESELGDLEEKLRSL